MITATLWGGPRDGEQVTVAAPYAPIPDVLQFPELTGPPGLEDWNPAAPDVLITSVTYRRRLKPRCCATWCAWPVVCTCCPQCDRTPLVYDLVPA